jgi:UDP-N-acetylglucosamine--N-acetylmuramyl-(pentapeptide) pyrophosphoryl-undecaprenol N-acetylglucosamine transferase
VDDHQTHNARFLVERGGGWLMNQTDFTPERLAAFLAGLDRAELLRRAEAAHAARRAGATEAIVDACERLLEPQITRDSP